MVEKFTDPFRIYLYYYGLIFLKINKYIQLKCYHVMVKIKCLIVNYIDISNCMIR